MRSQVPVTADFARKWLQKTDLRRGVFVPDINNPRYPSLGWRFGLIDGKPAAGYGGPNAEMHKAGDSVGCSGGTIKCGPVEEEVFFAWDSIQHLSKLEKEGAETRAFMSFMESVKKFVPAFGKIQLKKEKSDRRIILWYDRDDCQYHAGYQMKGESDVQEEEFANVLRENKRFIKTEMGKPKYSDMKETAEEWLFDTVTTKQSLFVENIEEPGYGWFFRYIDRDFVSGYAKKGCDPTEKINGKFLGHVSENYGADYDSAKKSIEAHIIVSKALRKKTTFTL